MSEPPRHLMRQHGPYRGADGEGRHWMAVDTARECPTALQLFYLGALIAGLVLTIALIHAHG